MANVAAVNQIVQANGFYKIGTSEAAELSKESMKQVTTIVEIANRIRRHRFGQTLTISDINEALVSRQMKPLIGYHSSYNVYDYVSVGKSRGNEIFAVDEPQLNLRELAKAEVPEYPKQVSFEFHWLAYRGIQPKVPENQTYVLYCVLHLFNI
ncbi:hypothetical protein TRFO_06835 [Tritrichomonas foetus]|uniref:TATA box binding protein associated factor (TAF) histone-like fold domain-containing protein n=1 Tax=Tritrichomonas foetus TaxID=1144522 RepID=A0A1J4JXG7_9EUKA|nr:hypothetical protein TRFO_06835 [Tritrichomonas foetus]|eukprot:OHT03160.1 hypothetical protein TRFO_06835 [Tritrichomonas foetus]